ncbi:MAG TPA: radical SAM family heme chaperone HemW [Nakamurella sp.]|nr:radical SAM family heme chaperone HemW [Nakamurella sp.]
MPSALPDGQPVPADGSLPDQAYHGMAERSLSLYLHVPFCTTRCGYCDFNTYTAGELGSAASPESWLDAALAEIDLAARVLTAAGTRRTVQTVFVGGGTPSLLGVGPLAALLQAVRDGFGLADDAEITTEANPESTDPDLLAGLREAGYTRVSLGMQSIAPHVLAVLERRHSPGRALQAARWAREAGLEHVSLDLIYGTPGESDADFAASLHAAVDAGVDHISAYSLIVEPGTRLARQVRTGALPAPSDDVLADRYVMADEILSAAGLSWYEVSNWASSPRARCRHNLAYWTGGDWWGIGPGAHSHVGGVRWWNVKHPAAYAAALAAGRSPGQGREVLDAEARRSERVLLELRLSAGLDRALLSGRGRRQAEREAADGLLDPAALAGGRAVLTRRGRLLADGIALRLLD